MYSTSLYCRSWKDIFSSAPIAWKIWSPQSWLARCARWLANPNYGRSHSPHNVWSSQNVLFIVKAKIFFLIKWSCRSPLTLTLEPRLVSKHVGQSLPITPILKSTPILKQEATTFVICNCKPDETMHDLVKQPKLELFVELEVPTIGHKPLHHVEWTKMCGVSWCPPIDMIYHSFYNFECTT